MLITINKFQNGCYSSVRLDYDSLKKLDNFCKDNKLPQLPEDVHCTVIYSKSVPKKSGVMNFSRFMYDAITKDLTWWEGHDKEGYLVLRLISKELSEEHDRFKKLGCVPTFASYEAHVTLKKGVHYNENDLKKPNLELTKNPISLRFGQQTVEDLR